MGHAGVMTDINELGSAADMVVCTRVKVALCCEDLAQRLRSIADQFESNGKTVEAKRLRALAEAQVKTSDAIKKAIQPSLHQTSISQIAMDTTPKTLEREPSSNNIRQDKEKREA